MKSKVARANRVLVLAVGAALVAAMSLVEARRYGDGLEYLGMLESLFQHSSPDLRFVDRFALSEEIRAAEESPGGRWGRPLPDDPRWDVSSQYVRRRGRFWSLHFWLYPLLGLPAKGVLWLSGASGLRALQVTNALLLWAALASIVLVSKLDEWQKGLFVLLLLASPVLWFVRWPHPEVFSSSFVVISLACMSAGRSRLAVAAAAVGATQNQPLVFLVGYLWLKGMIESRARAREAALLTLSAAPALASYVFNLVAFGTPSLLLRRAAGWENFTLLRVGEVFFDLNIGLVPYVPATAVLFLGLLARDLARGRWRSVRVQMLAVLIILAVPCTLTGNWNHGTSGPTRYSIWMLPLVLYGIVALGQDALAQRRQRAVYAALALVAIGTQAFVVVRGGGLAPRENQGKHTALARFVLDRFPGAYNPSPEIFVERTLGWERWALPVVYKKDSECRKVLARRGDEEKIRARCGSVPEPGARLVRGGRKKMPLFYFDY